MKPGGHIRGGRCFVRSGWVWLVAGLMAACTTRNPQPVRIGVLADLDTPGGPATVNAARLAVRAANDSGGVVIGGRRHPVELVIEDTRNTPQGAVEATRKLVNREGVVALVGPNISRNAIPVAELAERLGIPMITPGSSSPHTTAGKRYVFRATFTDPVQGRVMARFAREDLAAATAALLYDEANPYSGDLSAVFDSAFTALGGRVVARERYTTGATDFRAALDRIGAAGPAVLFLPNASRDVAVQAEQARAAGVEAVLLGTDVWSPVLLAGISAIDGAYFSHAWHPEDARDNPRARAFLHDYARAYGDSGFVMAALSYDAFGLLREALARAQAPTPGAIRDGLAAIRFYEGITGHFRFDGTGDPVKSLMISRFAGGRPEMFRRVDSE